MDRLSAPSAHVGGGARRAPLAWVCIAAGLAALGAAVGCGEKEAPKKKASDDDAPAAPMSSEERARSRQEDATKLCGKLQTAGLKEIATPSMFEFDMDAVGDGPDATKADPCEKFLVVLERDAPATFWKIASCLHDEAKSRGCVGELRQDDAFKKATDTLKEELKQERIAKFAAITELPTTPFALVLRNYGDADRTITLNLPSNLTQDADKSIPAFLRWNDTVTAKDGPSVTVMGRYTPPSLESAIAGISGSEKVVKQEKTNDGFVLVTESSYSLEVSVVRRLPPSDYGEQAIECKASLHGDKAIAAKDKILPWLEKLCTMQMK